MIKDRHNTRIMEKIMSHSQEMKLKEELICFFRKAIHIKEQNELENLLDNRSQYIKTPLVHIQLGWLCYMKQNGFFEDMIFPQGGDNGVSLMYELIECQKFEEFALIYQISQSYPRCFRYNRDENDKAIRTFRKKDLMIATIRLLDKNQNLTVEEMRKTIDLSIIELLSSSLREYRKHFFAISIYQREFERKHASEKDLEFADEKYIHSISDLEIILDKFQRDYNNIFFKENEDIMREIQSKMFNMGKKKDS